MTRDVRLAMENFLICFPRIAAATLKLRSALDSSFLRRKTCEKSKRTLALSTNNSRTSNGNAIDPTNKLLLRLKFSHLFRMNFSIAINVNEEVVAAADC